MTKDSSTSSPCRAIRTVAPNMHSKINVCLFMIDAFVFFFSQLIAHLDRNIDIKIICAHCADKFCSFRRISGANQHVLCVPVVLD